MTPALYAPTYRWHAQLYMRGCSFARRALREGDMEGADEALHFMMDDATALHQIKDERYQALALRMARAVRDLNEELDALNNGRVRQ
jgi:hypothetical protein